MDHLEHAEAKFDTLQTEIAAAIERLGCPSMTITAMYVDHANVIGGESMGVERYDAKGSPGIELGKMIPLLGYLEARCAVLRAEGNTIFGKEFGVQVEKEKCANLRNWEQQSKL